MKIERGKYYKGDDGRKYGPMDGDGFMWVKGKASDNDPDWYGDGKHRHLTEVDLITEWTDEPAAPKIWGNMTPKEKGALLLAHHEGKVIESTAQMGKSWRVVKTPRWFQTQCYRVRLPEPVRGTVTIAVDGNGDFSEVWQDDDARRITFPVVNCEVPTGIYTNEDGERIVVERVND